MRNLNDKIVKDIKNIKNIKSIESIDIDFQQKYYILAFVCDKCNYDCWYCYNKKPRSEKTINLDALYKFTDCINKIQNKDILLELIGGEPTLHPELYNFCKKAINNGISINIYTNFSQSVEFYEKLLYLGVNLYLSWHSLNNNFVDKFFQLNEHFKQQIFSSIMYEPNYSSLALQIFNSIPNNKCLTLIDANKTIYNEQQLFAYLNAKYDKKESYLVRDDSQSYLISEEFLVNNKLNKFKNWKCNALKEGIYIHFNGNVYPCQNYMTNCSKCLTNIYCQDALYFMSFHSVICPFDYCECGFSFTKSKKII